MSRIVVSQFVSVDGVIEDPVGMESLGRGAWSDSASSGEDGGKFKLDELMDADAMLFGRKTYDAYAAAWPTRTDQFSDRINAMPKYVVSSTLTSGDWNNTTVLSGDVADEVGALRDQDGGDIIIQGSGQLVDELARHDLVDEWRLMTFPIVVGKGARFFGDPGEARRLKLVEVRAVGDGVTIAIYVPARG